MVEETSTNSCVIIFFCIYRCHALGAGGAVHPKAAPMLRGFRFHGSGRGSQGKGD